MRISQRVWAITKPYLACLLLAACSLNAYGAARGGSNYNWYQLDGCNREPYGVLKNYHLAKATIDQQLAQMHANGQDRLRIGIYHGRGMSSGTVIDSTGGNLPVQERKNLTDLLAAVRAAGFTEIELGFFPLGNHNPYNWDHNATSWTSFHEDYFQENWNLLFNLMPIIQGSGLSYRVDLGNELSPPGVATRFGYVPYSYTWSQYAKKMWINFNIRFQRSESLGFSIPGDTTAEARIHHLSYVYGNTMPYLFDVHLYDDAYNRFRAIDNALDSLGLQQGLIIGESFYNDRLSANQIYNAIGPSARTVHYLAQWPLTRGSACSDVDVVPQSFNEYIGFGF